MFGCTPPSGFPSLRDAFSGKPNSPMSLYLRFHKMLGHEIQNMLCRKVGSLSYTAELALCQQKKRSLPSSFISSRSRDIKEKRLYP